MVFEPDRFSAEMRARNAERLESFRKAERLIRGVRWLATLDTNCCASCAALDGSTWDLNGQPLDGCTFVFQSPPMHSGCRCVLSPVPKSFQDFGISLSEPVGARASCLGPVPGDTTAEMFMRQHPEIALQILGAERTELLISGEKTLRDFVDDFAQVKPLHT